MSSAWGDLKRCIDLTDRQIARATASPEAMQGLLARFTQIAAPEQGAAKILLALARLTTCTWLEGTLRIEVSAVGDTSMLTVISDLGGGVRERIFPTTKLRVPLVEFTRAVQRVPHLIAPLTASSKQGALVLTATAETRILSMVPPMFEIDEQSLRRSLLPAPKRATRPPSKRPSPAPKAPSRRPAPPRPGPGRPARPAAHSPPAIRRKSKRPPGDKKA